jgi:hypothetical protein
MKKTDWPAIRKTAFSKETVLAGVAVGKQAITRLYRRSKNLRMSPLTIAAIITYLESRREKCPEDDPICKLMPAELDESLDTVYKQAFSKELLSSSKEYIYGGKENGGFFHLAMLAVKQLQYEALNDTQARPLDVEKDYKVQLYTKKAGQLKPVGEKYVRRTDIVLAGGADERPDKSSLLMEVKSWKGPIVEKYYKRWDLSRGKVSMIVDESIREDVSDTMRAHRQFFLDRVATIPYLDLPRYEPLAADFQWWFQEFKRSSKGRSSYTAADVSKAVSYMSDLPTNRKIGKESLGGNNDKTGLRQKAKLFNVKNWILVEGRRLLEGIADENILELIENESYDLTSS